MTAEPAGIGIFADLERQGVDPSRMGEAHGRFARPGLDDHRPIDAYVMGYQDGVRAALGLMPGLLSGVVDLPEFFARLCDPDSVAPIAQPPP